MCDAMSLVSAGNDFIGGVVGASDARSQANFEAGQMQIMGILVGADASHEVAGIQREFSDQFKTNIAASAVSGLSLESFSAIQKGNKAEERRLIKDTKANASAQKRSLDLKASMRQLQGRMEASAKMWSGVMSASDTLYKADQSYLDTNTGESRLGHLKKSFGTSFFDLKKGGR